MSKDATNKPLIYLAAALFTSYDRERNQRIALAIEAAGYSVFLPQNVEAPKTGSGLNMRVVYEGCLEGLKRCDAVLALVDGAEVDTGVAWELGYAAACGIKSISIRSDLRKSEFEGVNIMVEFGSTVMVYETGYRQSEAELIERMIRELQTLIS